MNASLSGPRHSAFTLTEMLLSVLLLAILAALAFLAERRVREASQAAQCVHNLRQIGVLYHVYVGENQGRSRFFIGGNQGMGDYGWYPTLQRKGNLGEANAQKAFGCPLFDWRDTRNWYCYGFRSGGAPGTSELLDDGVDGRAYIIDVARVAEPGKVLLAADTAMDSSLKLQSFRFGWSKAPDALIHLRHSGHANGLFLDGHVRALAASDLAAAGVDEAYSENGVVVKTGL